MREFLGNLRKYIIIISVFTAALLAGCASLIIFSPYVFADLIRYALTALCILAALHICAVIIRYLILCRKARRQRAAYRHG